MYKYPILFFVAEIPESLLSEPFKGGILGSICIFLLWADWDRRRKHDKTTDGWMVELKKMRESVNYLTHVSGYEVLTRPAVIRSAKDEVTKVFDAIKKQ